jgi:hypothetical protein
MTLSEATLCTASNLRRTATDVGNMLALLGSQNNRTALSKATIAPTKW